MRRSIISFALGVLAIIGPGWIWHAYNSRPPFETKLVARSVTVYKNEGDWGLSAYMEVFAEDGTRCMVQSQGDLTGHFLACRWKK